MPKATVTHNDTSITFSFPATGNEITVNLNELAPGIVTRLAMHGLEQKIRDSYSGASEVEAYAFAERVASRLRQGEWVARQQRQAGTGDILIRAVALALQRQGKPVPGNLASTIGALSRSDKAKLRATPAVAAAIAELRPSSEDVLASILG